MELRTTLVQRPELQLRLAPQIIASIEILQIPATKLEELIHQEMEKNPTIELEEPEERRNTETAAGQDPETPVVQSAAEAAEAAEAAAEQQKLDDGFGRLEEYESSFREFSSGYRGGGGMGDDGKDKKMEAMNNTAARGGTLQEHLASQLRLQDGIGEIVREFAEFVIYNINEDGYLPYTLEDLIRSFDHEIREIEEGEDAVESADELIPVSDDPVGGGLGPIDPDALVEDDAPPPLPGLDRKPDVPEAFRRIPSAPLGTTGIEAFAAGTDASPAPSPFGAPAAAAPTPAAAPFDPPAAAAAFDHAPAEVATAEAAPARAEGDMTSDDDLDDDLEPLGSGRITVAEANEALALVKALDPPGVAARDLQECLLLQLQGFGDDDLEWVLISKHLEDIKNNRLPKIAKETGSTIDEIKEALELIRGLTPFPGRVFSSDAEQTQYITPDVLVDKVEGRWEVRLEDSFIPRINVSEHYRRMLIEKKDDPKVRDWIKKKIDDANWLISAIAQRQDTLSKIAREIVKYQEGFLEAGVEALRPLKMQQIADRVGVHVSTVSRAIASKHIQTPRGIKPLKFFFTAGTARADGESESIVAIKKRVREIVGAEDKRCPLSDEEIAAKLKEAGLDIARRTVTKYRKQLKIPSSRQRREY